MKNRRRLSHVVGQIGRFLSGRFLFDEPETMDRLRAEIQAIDDELPKLDPTPCGVCGSVIGEGLMILHMGWHREISTEARRYKSPPTYR